MSRAYRTWVCPKKSNTILHLTHDWDRLKIGTEVLLKRFRRADDLLEPIGQMRPLSELELMEPTHSAIIEFIGSPGSDFRLELYLKRIARAREVEIKGHRWFKARHGEDKTLRIPLQLAMVDFAR